MDLKVGIFQQHTLKLAMTQELKTAIALLQYSAHELTVFLENKAQENPLFNLQTTSNRRLGKTQKKSKDKNDWIEQIADKTVSLEEQILVQLDLKKYSPLQLSLIKTILLFIDENGYFRGDLAEIAGKRNVPLELAAESLRVVQNLEPAGIGARNLQECILLQLKRKNPADELALKIISDYFDLFAEKKWKQLSKELNIDLKEIQTVFDRIQGLNPKPGAELFPEQPHYIVPDAIIETENGGISVRLWEEAVPQIHFNESYFKKFSKIGDHQVGKFLQEKLQDYQWITKSIEQRKETLAKVILKITEKQPQYFLKGPNFLVPMTMKELAQELNVHESTISRAVREKYVQTPWGTVSLKAFFSSMIQTVSDDQTSSSQVKNALFAIVEKENKQNPFSDQEIVDILKKDEGIKVSRRTVAKYRDQLGIPSSAKRKRY